MTIDFTPGPSVCSAQCLALLAALKQSPISTLEARDSLGIASPAARVLELRKAGHLIETSRATRPDSAGRLHAVALYTLKGKSHD